MSKDDVDFNYIGVGQLKTVSQKEIEKVIGKAVSKLVDDNFSCSIKKIKYKGLWAELEMSLSYKTEKED